MNTFRLWAASNISQVPILPNSRGSELSEVAGGGLGRETVISQDMWDLSNESELDKKHQELLSFYAREEWICAHMIWKNDLWGTL